MQPDTHAGLGPNAPFAPRRVRVGCVSPVRDQHAGDVGVEEVVHDVHVRIGDQPAAIDIAPEEGGAGGVEGRFPEIGEFAEDVGDAWRSARVEENDQTGAVGDHFPEGWPGVRGLSLCVRGDVGVGFDAAGNEGLIELADVDVVPVSE